MDVGDRYDLNNRNFFLAGPNHVSDGHVFVTETHISDDESKSFGEQGNAGSSKNSCDAESSADFSHRDGDTKRQTGQDFDQQGTTETRKKNRVMHSAVIGRVAKTVKASTVITGKHVIKQSKNAGRAAGRVIPVSSVVYKPPRKHEPGEYHCNIMVFSQHHRKLTSILSKAEECMEDGLTKVT